MYTLILPLNVPVSKSRSFSINLNTYRNAHYQTLNKAKIRFKEAVTDQVKKLPKYKWVHLTYIVYPKTNRKFDISNVCSVADKFFCDALVELGHLPDDNYRYIDQVTYLFGSVDPKNPRIEVQLIGELL